MDEVKYKQLLDTFESTVHNCSFYLQRNKMNSFLNEVGTGKGLLYAFQLYDKLPTGESLTLFMSYMNKAKDLLKEERRTMFK